MINKKLALKVKVKHLAEEARIIRFEEQRQKGDTRNWLYRHRIDVVRPEARATNIAYAFAKGTPLHKVEKYPNDIPTSVWARVARMRLSYSDKSSAEYLKWLSTGNLEDFNPQLEGVQLTTEYYTCIKKSLKKK